MRQQRKAREDPSVTNKRVTNKRVTNKRVRNKREHLASQQEPTSPLSSLLQRHMPRLVKAGDMMVRWL